MTSPYKETLKVTGNLSIVVTDKNGKVKEERNHSNLVVTTGKNFIASCLHDDPGPTRIGFMATGTTSTAPSVTDTQLGTEVARVALGNSEVADNLVVYSAIFGPGVGTGAITEAALFNAATAGTMLCRTTFPVVNKEVDDTVTINWNVTIS